jgi:hypothetical protein
MSLITKGYGTILAVVVFKFDEGGYTEAETLNQIHRKL